MMENVFRSSKNGKHYTEEQIVAHGMTQLAEGKNLTDISNLLMANFGFTFEIRDRILGRLDQQPEPVACTKPLQEEPPPAGQNMDDAIIAMNDQLDADMVITTDKVDQMERWIKVRMSDRAMDAVNDAFTATKRRKLNYQDWAIIALLHADSVRKNPHGASPHSRFIEFSATANEWIKPIFSCHVHRVLAALELMGFTKKIAAPKRGQATTYTVIEIE